MRKIGLLAAMAASLISYSPYAKADASRWCAENEFLCALGVVAGGIVAYKALSGPSSNTTSSYSAPAQIQPVASSCGIQSRYDASSSFSSPGVVAVSGVCSNGAAYSCYRSSATGQFWSCAGVSPTEQIRSEETAILKACGCL